VALGKVLFDTIIFFRYNIGMYWFCLKKNFCDGWDNIFLLLIANLTVVLLSVGAFFAISAVMINEFLLFLCFALFLCITMIPIFAFGSIAVQLSNFKSSSLKEFFTAFARVWKDAVFFALIVSLLSVMAVVVIPFYFRMNSLLGLALSAVIFWVLVLSVLALQWFIPLRFLLNNDSFFKSVKKCYIIFFDNAAFSVGYFIYQFVLMALSLFTFFLLPSFSGLVLNSTNALRLRLYKYDWLEEHRELTPGSKERKHIPWDELLAEDRETLGPRSLKSFIFPWKD
jgi:hypothetical protein